MLQRSETVRRVAEEIETSIVELGAEAQIIRLQMDELLEDVDDDRELALLDYLPTTTTSGSRAALAELASLTTDDSSISGRRLHAAPRIGGRGREGRPRPEPATAGPRLLAKMPRPPEDIATG